MRGSGRFFLVPLVGLAAKGSMNCVDPFRGDSSQCRNRSLGGTSSVGLVVIDLPSPLAKLGRLGIVFATTPARLSMSVSRRISSSERRVCICEPCFLGTNRGNLVREGRVLPVDSASGDGLLLPGGRLGTGGGASSKFGSVSGRETIGGVDWEVVPERDGSFIRGWLTLRLSALKKLILEESSEGNVENEEPGSMFDSLVRPRRALLACWWSLGFMRENEEPLKIAPLEWGGGRAWAGRVS